MLRRLLQPVASRAGALRDRSLLVGKDLVTEIRAVRRSRLGYEHCDFVSQSGLQKGLLHKAHFSLSESAITRSIMVPGRSVTSRKL